MLEGGGGFCEVDIPVMVEIPTDADKSSEGVTQAALLMADLEDAWEQLEREVDIFCMDMLVSNHSSAGNPTKCLSYLDCMQAQYMQAKSSCFWTLQESGTAGRDLHERTSV